jgi:hypothetical protein
MCRPFSYTNYLAVRSAFEIQKPDKIYMHCNVEPKDNLFWNEAKKYFTIIYREPLQEFSGIKLEYPHYQSDIARLQILFEHGGIYLDNDLLMLKPFNELMNNHCVMGADGYNEQGEIKSVANGLILSRPKEKVIQLWLDEIPNALRTGIWAYHAVVTPLQLWKTDNSLFNLENVEKFIPFDFYNPYIFYEGNEQIKYAEEKLKESFTIHVWETWWAKDHLAKLGKEYFQHSNSFFAKTFKSYSI